MNTEFKEWQNLYIESLKYGSITINQAITNFIDEGLNPFITKRRYAFELNKHQLGEVIATCMFKFENSSIYMFPTRKGVNFSDEYFQYFEYVINDEEWESFWNYWDRQLDYIFNNSYDSRLTLQLKHIVWMFIDLEKSVAHNEYIEMNRVFDEYQEQEKDNPYRKIDPYILDQMSAINHPKFYRFENS